MSRRINMLSLNSSIRNYRQFTMQEKVVPQNLTTTCIIQTNNATFTQCIGSSLDRVQRRNI